MLLTTCMKELCKKMLVNQRHHSPSASSGPYLQQTPSREASRDACVQR